MTAPVLIEAQGNSRTMSFVLPKNISLDSAPLPDSSEVLVREVPSRLVAALEFTGSMRDDLIEQKTIELQGILERSSFEVVGFPVAAGYDPPWTLPFLRKNEMLVEVIVK